jgi:hypothetical protein
MPHGKICYLEIPANRAENSARFYARIFGWRVRERGDSASMRTRTIAILRLLWLAACAAVVIVAMFGCKDASAVLRNECRFLWGDIGLAILGLPLSIAWWLVANATSPVLSVAGIEMGMTTWFGAAVYVGFVAVGYFQWFVLLPIFVRRVASRFRSTRL